jgi:hypothetical protein
MESAGAERGKEIETGPQKTGNARRCKKDVKIEGTNRMIY